eukprot:759390-Hanusia_phi.AAC.2
MRKKQPDVAHSMSTRQHWRHDNTGFQMLGNCRMQQKVAIGRAARRIWTHNGSALWAGRVERKRGEREGGIAGRREDRRNDGRNVRRKRRYDMITFISSNKRAQWRMLEKGCCRSAPILGYVRAMSQHNTSQHITTHHITSHHITTFVCAMCRRHSRVVTL